MTLLDQLERAFAQLRRRGGRIELAGRSVTRAQATEWLSRQLYQRHHLAWDGWSRPHVLGEPDFVAALARATLGCRYLDDGWKAVSLSAEGLLATNGWAQVWVSRRARAWVPVKPRRGQRVKLSFPCAREGWLPGYFVMVSRAGRPSGSRVKLYLNLTPEGAVEWTRLLFRHPGLAVPFDAKVFNHPLAFGRRDTGVLYVAARDASGVAQVLRRFVRRRPALLRAEPVPFTLKLGRGLSMGASLAVEDAEQISYGEVRCALVAKAALSAWLAGIPSERWTPRFERAFRDAGTDYARPWLGEAKLDWSSLSVARRRQRRGRPTGAAGRR